MSGIFSAPKVPAPPPPPDPAATVEAQLEASQIAQLTPFGTQIYGTLDAEGNFVPREESIALQIQESPFQLASREGREALGLTLISQLLGEQSQLAPVRTPTDIEGALPMMGDLTGLGEGLPSLTTDFTEDARRVEEATYDAAVSRLQPQFDRQTEALEEQLINQGLPRGSEAFQEELERLREAQGEQLNRVALDAVAAGRQEQSRLASLAAATRGTLLGEQVQELGLQNALRGQALQEQFGFATSEGQLRQQRFNELASLLGITPQFQQFQTPIVDVAGIINQGYQNQLGAFGMQQQLANQARQQQSGNLAALGQLGGMALGSASAPTGSLFGYNLWGG